MKPASPVIPNKRYPEVVFAKDQPQYLQLPALYVNGGTVVLSRWRLTWKERLIVLFKGDLFLQQKTFGQPLQPQLPSVTPPYVQEDYDG